MYLISCNNQLNGFQFEPPNDVAISQGINPVHLSVFRAWLIKPFEHLYALYLKTQMSSSNWTKRTEQCKWSKNWLSYHLWREIYFTLLYVGQYPVVKTWTLRSTEGCKCGFCWMYSPNLVCLSFARTISVSMPSIFEVNCPPKFFFSSMLGDSELSLSYTKNKRVFSVARVPMRKAQAKPREFSNTFSFSQNPFFDQYPSSPAEPPNKLRITRGIRVSVRLSGFPHDETPETNLAHPVSLGLRFAWGVSSSLTSNGFKFVCFRWRKVPGERGVSKRVKVFSRQTHVMTTRKAPRFAAWHHEVPITWRPNWRFPKNSLAHSVLTRFTRGYSRSVKNQFASL
jgi:hypothetical protein